nr:endonuclease [Psychrobacillus soli]
MSKWNWKKPINAVLSVILVASLFIPALPTTVVAETTKTVETFDNLTNTTNSYVTENFVGINSIIWNYADSRGGLDAYTIDGKGLMLRNASYIESNTIQDGISKISVDYKTAYTSAGERQIEVFINGESKGVSPAVNTDNTATQTFELENINIAGPFTIKIVGKSSPTGRQITIDNITWTNYEASEPVVETQVKEVKATPTSSTVEAGTKVELSTATTGDTAIFYTTNGVEPTTADNEYTAPITIIEDTTIKAIAVDNDITRNLDNSDIATFTYTIQAPLTTISIAEAREIEKKGQEVMVTGTVTALLDTATAHIQDSTGAIAIYPASSLSANVGDIVTVKGTVAEYSGLIQLTNITLVGEPTASTLPAPLEVTSAGVIEENESKLVTLKNVSITGAGRDFTGTDADGKFAIYDKTEDSGLVAGVTYGEITGIVGQYGTVHQILPISVVEDTTKVQNVQASKSGGVTAGTSVTLSTITQGATIHYTMDGSTPTTSSAVYTSGITINEPMTIKATAVKEGLTDSAIATFTYEIINTDGATISGIQGANHTSSYLGLTVNEVEGVVTYVINTSNFIMQEANNSTYDNVKSNAIKVNKSSHGVNVGDKVKVTGVVGETGGNSRLTDTSIAATSIMKDGTAELPAPLVIGEDITPPNKIIDNDGFAIFDPAEDGIDFWESIEYMNVSFPDARIVGPPYSNDVPIVVPSTTNNTFNVNGGLNIAADDYNPEKIMLEGVSDKDYESGDRFDANLIGFVENFTDGYRLNTNNVFPTVTKANNLQEVTHITEAADKLTVAAYNIENFSNNKDNTKDEKVAKIAGTFVQNMKSPDIITLVEVQDNDGQTDSGNADASESYLRLINAIEAADGPSYDWVDVTPVDNTVGGAPGGNIRIGYLYNPQRVSLVTGAKGTGTDANSWTNAGNLALNPGFIDPTKFNDTRKPLAAEFEFQGERVVVIGAHLNSKGGDGSLWGPTQPPVLGSVPERLGLAQAINDFIDEGLAKNPDLNIVVAGDMNDFEFTPALETLKGGVLTNMVDKVPVEDRFSYFFQGNNQVLDHILVSNNLVNATVADMIHINANFTDAQGRASDHDPVLVQIDLAAAEDVVTPITAQKLYDFKNLKTNKLTITKPSISLTLGENTTITNGVLFTGDYAEFHGDGFADQTVTIKPNKAGAIIDFKGTIIEKIIIDGTNVKQIRALPDNVEIEYKNGASPANIEFVDGEGNLITEVPSFPNDNNAPVIKKAIPNATVIGGEKVSVLLTDYFSDSDNDKLIFTSTKGIIEGATLTLTLEVGSHIVGVTATDGDKSITTSFIVTVGSVEESPLETYYRGAIGKEGQVLKAALHEIIDDHTELTYAQVWEALRETDEDPNNNNNVILFYSGVSRSKNSNGGNSGQWNREHTWAKSHGDFGTSKGPGTDIHHLRATDVQVNGLRGNLDFDNGGSPVNGCNGCFKTATSFEPPDRVKGDVARILFYMATRYEPGDKVDLELNEKLNNGKDPYHGKLSVLLQWHLEDPVDEVERKRNNIIQQWQGNRNPFIDHPEWVNLIWKQPGSASVQKVS